MSLSSVSGKEQDDILKQIGTRENELYELGAK